MLKDRLIFIIGLVSYTLGGIAILHAMWSLDWAMYHQEMGTPVILEGWTDAPRYLNPWEWFHINLLQVLPIGLFLALIGVATMMYSLLRGSQK